jgi:hypothetical protein
MTLAQKIRQKLWTYKQPLTKDPEEVGAPVSDLFLWRVSPLWNTYFELINTPKLIDTESGNCQSVKFYFLDIHGSIIKKTTVSLDGNLHKRIDLAPMVSDLDIDAGTFCVFHSDIPESVTLAGSYIAERGYVSYQYNNSTVRSYVHGNLDAVSLRLDDSLLFLEARSFLPRAYNLQHPLESGCIYEFALANPSNSKIAIECKVLDIEGNLIEQDKVKLEPGGSHIFKFNITSLHSCRLNIKSHLVMARPLVYKYSNKSLNVFHG